jgi:hypothetical protein
VDYHATLYGVGVRDHGPMNDDLAGRVVESIMMTSEMAWVSSSLPSTTEKRKASQHFHALALVHNRLSRNPP